MLEVYFNIVVKNHTLVERPEIKQFIFVNPLSKANRVG
jgi:hypothetical protein